MNEDAQPDPSPSDPRSETEQSTVSASPLGEPGGTIGPYRLLHKLGEGGMGEVWLAEQSSPVHRRVALKLIKAGMDTSQVVARFEAERQALALMEHPAIAKVFDAGETPAGRPYFVMEYVQGVSLTEHCDRHRLTTHERLELFQQVCEGVQHAHHKAIIHRDLKPSNVLVTMQEGRPTPKIIDFGVAKATSQRLTERTMFTELGVLIGTPEYMSPEQADLTAQDVDSRTDVYSLGVMLYELLVGALPLDPKDLRRAGFDEIRRQIREVEPPKPSTRLGTLGQAATTESARRRQADVKTLRRQLRGDLDWITMKSLDKDRSRRYSSPAELAADIGRHLRNEPVIASPPGAGYRSGKFVRRHRFGVAAVVTAVAALAVFAGAMAFQLKRTSRERERAEAISGFLTSLFASSNPRNAGGKEFSLRAVLDKGAKRIDKELAGKPEIQAPLLDTIGWVYVWLGRYGEAESLLTRALALHRQLLGDDHTDTLRCKQHLGVAYERQGKWAEAEKLHREVLTVRRRILGQEHPETLWAMNNVAATLHVLGRDAEAEAIAREALEKHRRVSGEDHPDTLWVKGNLADILLGQGRAAEAEGLFREALEQWHRVLGNDHPDSFMPMSGLASAVERQGRQAEAEGIHRQVVERCQRILGADHPQTLQAMTRLGSNLFHQNRIAEARELFSDVLEKRRRVLGDDHPETIMSMVNVADSLWMLDRAAEGEALSRDAVERSRRALGEDDPDTLRSTTNLGYWLYRAGRHAEAETIYRGVLAQARKVPGERDPLTIELLNDLAAALSRQSRNAEAESVSREALSALQSANGQASAAVASQMYNIACYSALQGDRVEAIDLLRQAVAQGYRNGSHMAKDPDLLSLHGDPAFEALLAGFASGR